jgi:putative transposase
MKKSKIQRDPDRQDRQRGTCWSMPVPDVCRKHNISTSTFYKWRAKYGGLDASELKRIRELEEENRRLKQMYAELSLDHAVLKDIIEKKL